MSTVYDHPYESGTVYSRVIELLGAHAGTDGVHIDIGCGYGAIAEPLREAGLTYVGFDLDTARLEALNARGFETHAIDLSDERAAIVSLREALGERKLTSISMIDTLEHITNGPAFLRALREFVENRAALFVLAVPNVAHRDLAAKLLTGRWDYTVEGLLDHTHVIHHTDRLLGAMMSGAGWTEVSRADFHRQRSDQYFPKFDPVVSDATPLNRFIGQIREGADEFSSINELVRAFLPGPVKPGSLVVEPDAKRPFLSIVMRTQGRRLATFRDLLLALTAQTCQDFELIVIPHKVEFETQKLIERIVEDMPTNIRSRARVVPCDRGGRTTPLNFGFELARGHYISILDDDEMIFAHWVETFKKLAEKSPGRMLRVVAAEQDIAETPETAAGGSGYAVVAAIRHPFPKHYDLYAHFLQNYSPPVALAFPGAAYHELGLRFDETLNTAEDWDFELRCVMLCGFEASPEITCIYHKWKKGESSYSIHSQSEWERDYGAILSNFDRQYHVFPPGTIKLINDQRKWILKLEGDLARTRRTVSAKRSTLEFLHRHPTLLMLASRSNKLARQIGRRIVRRLR
ncbi:methyltransferase domain-containing protein [Caballeronia sp. GAWG2-1]|jgi:glycosyltransferase involved in cell wall biosynthesis|uniref:methyltransferase domain-containing protein n=1 Tax=Caballeronia sp. GAWG2-1 TaxID=2921744 RepID=UPI002028418E|nr:methyltransferase domain-containing protein [Caballeronia sp. GAWG2-1]